MNKPINRVAAVHDMSGFGKTSLTVVIPILSTMGIQVCPLPTAILSSHTGGFEGYKFVDLTNEMTEYIEHWKKLNIKFDCIYSGFLGSASQISIVTNFIKYFKDDESLVVIDPVMGDDGKTYAPFGQDMVDKMKKFIEIGDIITPNMTEAALLLDEDYKEVISVAEVKDWLKRLSEKGPKIVIITSVVDTVKRKTTSVIAYNKEDDRFWKVECDYIPARFPGTGDCFTSVVVGSLLQGDSLPIALDRSVQFITTAIKASYGYKYDIREGVILEKVIGSLNSPVSPFSYEIME